uniref:Wsv023-like protein n=1 Tax=Sicyonia whispovirus TaxID=2984283 RepID=A0A9C7EZ55_9VIRU|nr:MAG: wsv023-like protein [Sicyonia whispovirus]
MDTAAAASAVGANASDATIKRSTPGRGEISVDVASVINSLASLIPVVDNSHPMIMSTYEHLNCMKTSSAGAEKDTASRKKAELYEMVSSDIEKAAGANANLKLILKDVANLCGFSSALDLHREKPSTASKTVPGEASGLAKKDVVHDPLMKLSLLSCMLRESEASSENLRAALNEGKNLWAVMPAAVYTSLDCLCMLSLLWIIFGSSINLKNLADSKEDVVLPHDSASVEQGKAEVQLLQQARLNLMGGESGNQQIFPVEDLLGRVILPAVEKARDALTGLSI